MHPTSHSQYQSPIFRSHIDSHGRQSRFRASITCLVFFAVPLATYSAGDASAQEVDSETTAPILSSEVNAGAPGDVIITEDGSITLTEQEGVIAVTMDSDNGFENEGFILVEDSDNSVGLLIDQGLTGNLLQNGSISVSETYEREDADDDDDVDGVYAIGTNRVGVLLAEGGAHIGDLSADSSATILVEGNDSAGVLLGSALDGTLSLDGSISVVGDNARSIVAQEDISGDVRVSANTFATGENSSALQVLGDVGGTLAIDSAVISTGFASTTSTNYLLPSSVTDDTDAVEDRIDADELFDNLGTVMVRGSVADGLLINGTVDTFTSEEDLDDEVKDTVDDFDENRSSGSITSYGSGAALSIAPDAGALDLTLGTVTETIFDTLDDDEDDDTTEQLVSFDYDYGLINRGTVTADGTNVGFSAEALSIEGNVDTGAQAIIEGGIQNSGTISATAFEADAVSLSLGDGTRTPVLINEGSISAITYTTAGNAAVAVQIGADTDLTSLVNSGTITASSIGESGQVTAISSLNGQLVSITNQGGIQAATSDDGEDVEDPSVAVALDLSSYSAAQGVTVQQSFAVPVDDTNFDDEIDSDDVTSPFIIGDILFGAGADFLQVGAGGVAGDVYFDLGDGAYTLSNATHIGDAHFEDGVHELSLSNAAFQGDVYFTDSDAAFVIDAGASFNGAIATSNAALDLSILDSSIEFSSGNVSTLETFTASGDTDLIFDIDPANTEESILNVTGIAEIGEEVQITPVLNSISETNFRQTLITADEITSSGQLAETDLAELPYIYTTSLDLRTEDADYLDLVFDLKSTEDLGLDPNQSAAFEPLLGIFQSDEDLGAELSSITTEAEFNQAYNLLLPQRTNASTRYLAAQTNASMGALGDRLDLLAFVDAESTGVWVQEHFTWLEQDADEISPGFNGDGLGLSVGADRPLLGFDSVGLILSYSSGTFEEKTGGFNPNHNSQLGIGTYVQEKVGPINLRLVGQVADVDFSSTREVDVGSLSYDIEGEWKGFSQALAVAASTEFKAGQFYARPEISADWYSLSQDGYSETGGGGVLAAQISDVDTHESSANLLLTVGHQTDFKHGLMRIEAKGGYRSILSAQAYEADVQFLGADESFTLTAFDETEDAALFGLSFVSDTSIISARFGYDLELSNSGMAHFAGATLRLKLR